MVVSAQYPLHFPLPLPDSENSVNDIGDIPSVRNEYLQIQQTAVIQECKASWQTNKKLPLLEEHYAWLQTIHPEKGSKPEEAVRCSLNQKQPLTAFLSNGQVPISNNLTENAIRPFTLGRKNWLFCDTTRGRGQRYCVFPGGK